jgi:hypothetical protein
MTWILGNRLITVTTSGCSNKAMRGGLCDNCWAACKPGFLLLDHTKTSHSNLQRTSSIEVFSDIFNLFIIYKCNFIYIFRIYITFLYYI